MSLENLALRLSEDDRKKIARQILEDFESDCQSREGWLKLHNEWLRIYYQMDRPKAPAWEGASDETMPLLVEACTQYHARAYTALFPNRNIIAAVPTLKLDPQVEARAKRVGKHMSWQLTVRDRAYRSDKDRLLLGQPLHGSFFTKTYFHAVSGRNMVENVRPEDLVVPYGIGPRDIEQIERKTQIVWQTLNETRILAAAQFYLFPGEAYDLGQKTPTQETTDKAQGITEPMEKGLACILEQHCIWDLDGDGIGEPYIAWVDRQSRKLLRLTARYDKNPAEPIEYFTHYPYMTNPEGFYGLGHGHLIAPINKAVNKLLRQAIDGGTLAIIGNMSGFISSQIPIKGGELKLEMGKFPKVDMVGDDIKKGIFQFQFPYPSPHTMQLIALLSGRSDRLASVTELTTGQPEKVYQPTMAMALIEQAQQVYTAVYQRTRIAWQSELQKYYDLNTKYLPDVEPFAVFQPDGSVENDAVTRDDYAPDLMVVPVADPQGTTKEQKMAKAQVEFQFLAQNPLVLQNPVAYYYASRRFLESIETQDIDQVLPPPVPAREDDPYKENMAALMPMPMIPPAYPDQDHQTHILVHRELLDGKDPASAFLPPEGGKALMGHVQMHIAQLYGIAHGGMNGAAVEGAQGGIPEPGMANGGDLGGFGALQGAA